MNQDHLSLQSVPTLTSLVSANKALVVLSAGDANAAQGDMQLGMVALSDYAAFLNAGLTSRVSNLEATLAAGITVAGGGTGTDTLTGLVKGNGTAPFSAAVAGMDYLTPIPGVRNLLINALGTINQRAYVSGTATTVAKQYTLDRWCVLVQGQNLAWTTANGIATMTAPAGGVAQVVEGPSIAGGSYSLSWTGTAQGAINGSVIAKGASATLPANTNATVTFSNGTFAQPQLELGPPTAFDWHPFGLEAVLSLRYCYAASYIAGTGLGAGVEYNTGMAFATLILPTSFGRTPTMTMVGQGLSWTGAGTSSGPPSLTWVPKNTAVLLFPITGGVVGRAGYFNATGTSGANTLVIFDAELVP